MTARLLLNISQLDEYVKPYTFKMTNINVFSFEEALFHCYTYWKQSVDDFTCAEFISWVANDLSMTVIASKIRELSDIKSFSDKFLSFLTLIDYFEDDRLVLIRSELIAWEIRKEWEKYKERGDYLINNAEYDKAFIMYKKALLCSPEIAELHNNAAIALMKQGFYADAVDYLDKALSLKKERAIMLNLAEALLHNKEYDRAKDVLVQAEEFGMSGDILCFYGQIEFHQGNYMASIAYYEKALEIESDSHYMYCLSDVYVKLRQYDKAIETLSLVEVKDKVFLKKLADFYVTYNNIPAAIKCIEKALISDNNSIDLWTRLASYHRLDYDLNRANSAIVKALGISKTNAKANLEYARIKKAQGKIKDYQIILHDVLNGFKENYRENITMENKSLFTELHF